MQSCGFAKLLEKAVFSFGTPTPEVWTVVEEGGVNRSYCSSAFLLWPKKPPSFTLILLLIFEAVILPFCIPYTFMSAVLCTLEI